MSLSDLELLQLVDTLKAKQRGPKGETGVGISEIDQFDETGFTIRLTDGSFKRVNLPTPKDGEVGAAGPRGPKGDQEVIAEGQAVTAAKDCLVATVLTDFLEALLKRL